MNNNAKEVESSKKITFVPVIQDTNVIQLSINGKKLNLKREITLKDFTENFLPLLEQLKTYIDLQNFASSKNLENVIAKDNWDVESFRNYWIGLMDVQKEIIRILFEDKEIVREQLVKQLVKNQYFEKIDGTKKLGAIVAGMTRKWNNLNFEPIFVIYNNKYFFNEKIKDKIGVLLEELINGERDK